MHHAAPPGDHHSTAQRSTVSSIRKHGVRLSSLHIASELLAPHLFVRAGLVGVVCDAILMWRLLAAWAHMHAAMLALLLLASVHGRTGLAAGATVSACKEVSVDSRGEQNGVKAGVGCVFPFAYGGVRCVPCIEADPPMLCMLMAFYCC